MADLREIRARLLRARARLKSAAAEARWWAWGPRGRLEVTQARAAWQLAIVAWRAVRESLGPFACACASANLHDGLSWWLGEEALRLERVAEAAEREAREIADANHAALLAWRAEYQARRAAGH